MLTTATRLTRRVPAINLGKGASIPGGLVLQLADELAPSHVADMLCQAVIFQQVLHGQALYANHLVFADDACREFVLEIAAFVGDLRVQAGNLPPRFGTVLGAFFLSGETALRPRQPFFGFDVEPWVFHNLPAREGDHRFDPYINADHLRRDRQRVDIFFHQHGDEVAVSCVFRDGHRCGLASTGQRTRPDDMQGVFHLRKGQLTAVPRECACGIRSRLHPVFALEFGISGTSLEEVTEGSLQMPQGLLEWDTGDFLQPSAIVLLFEPGELGRGVIVGNALLFLYVGVCPQAQGPVVREANTAKGTGKYSRLLVGGVKSIQVGAFLFSLHILLFFFTLPKAEKQSTIRSAAISPHS